MNELIQQLQQKAGLSAEQANSALQTIKQFVVEKFPMLAGAVDNIFPNTPGAGTGTTTPANPTQPAGQNEGFLDKISDYIPGENGQRIEDFAKKAASGASDFFNKK